MSKLEKAIKYVDKLWKQQPNQLGIMPDLNNEFMWVVEFLQEQQNELDELKRDVARFTRVVSKPTWLNTIESANYDYLKNKLSKGG